MSLVGLLELEDSIKAITTSVVDLKASKNDVEKAIEENTKTLAKNDSDFKAWGATYVADKKLEDDKRADLVSKIDELTQQKDEKVASLDTIGTKIKDADSKDAADDIVNDDFFMTTKRFLRDTKKTSLSMFEKKKVVVIILFLLF